MLVEGAGLPISVEIAGANRHDIKLIEATLRNIVVERPAPSEDEPQNLCLDKGYDSKGVRELLEELGYTAHIRARNEEAADLRVIPGYRARRWKVERTHSWLNRFRRILIRWEKKACNYLGMLHFACALIVFRSLGFFG
jgi:putative transposase